MKTIGLIGGMSWESSVTYYQIINRAVQRALGGLHSARCVLYSLDFHEVEQLQSRGDWDKAADVLAEAGLALARAGADFVVICTNTMHKVADQVQARLPVPIIHIADETARELKTAGVGTAALLGTRYTMEDDFYKGRLESFGFKVIVPEAEDRARVNDVIYGELCRGVINPASKKMFLEVIEGLAKRGAEGIILGCTEIGLLVRPGEASRPLFDTAEIHALGAAKLALA